LKVQTELLLKFLDAASERNVAFAVPLTESLTIPYEANTVSRGFLSPAEGPANGTNKAAAPASLETADRR
jgi:hypothetical protein